MKKRLIAALVCLAMLISLLPTTALAGAATSVLIAGTEVSAGDYWKNKSDNSGIEAGSPTDWNVRYDSGTLYLKGLDVRGSSASTGDCIYAIYVNRDITFDLTDTSSVTTADSADNKYIAAVYVDNGTLTISGSGTLNATGGAAAQRDTSGVYVNKGSLNIASGTLRGTSGSGVHCSGVCAFNDVANGAIAVSGTGALEGTGGMGTVSSYGVYAVGPTGVSVSSGMLKGTGTNAGISSDRITITGGSINGVIAGSVPANGSGPVYKTTLTLLDGNTAKPNTVYKSSLGQCENPVADAFLYNRIEELQAQGVDVSADVSLPVSQPLKKTCFF